MAELLLEYPEAITSEDGKNYTARACGSESPDGKWQGWIEFVPLGDGEPVRSSRETTQPNRRDAEYWASGLSYVYLQGALRRALRPLVRPVASEPAPPLFDGPAPIAIAPPTTESVLDPFSVYRKGEALLRRQLAALAGWHLVNIIRHYDLSGAEPAVLNAQDPARLIEIIVDGVRQPRSLTS